MGVGAQHEPDRRGARGTARSRCSARRCSSAPPSSCCSSAFATSWIGCCCWCTRSAARPPPTSRRGRWRRRRSPAGPPPMRRRRRRGGGGPGTTAEGDVAYAEFAPEIAEASERIVRGVRDGARRRVPRAVRRRRRRGGGGRRRRGHLGHRRLGAALRAGELLARRRRRRRRRAGRPRVRPDGLGALRGGKRRRKAKKGGDVGGRRGEGARGGLEGAGAPSGWYEESAVVDALVQYVVGAWRRQAPRGAPRARNTTFMQRFANGLGDRLGDDLAGGVRRRRLRPLRRRRAGCARGGSGPRASFCRGARLVGRVAMSSFRREAGAKATKGARLQRACAQPDLQKVARPLSRCRVFASVDLDCISDRFAE